MTLFPLYLPDHMNCRPTHLRMVAKHYGRSISLEKLQQLSETTREGSNLQNISNAAENIGFRTLGVKIDFSKLEQDAPLPCIVHWQQKHFVVVYKIKKGKVYVADPAHGLLSYTTQEFIDNWINKTANEHTEEGITLLLEPTPKLKESQEDDQTTNGSFGYLYQYLFR